MEDICNGWRIYVMDGGYMSWMEDICNGWRIYVMDGGYM